MIEGVQVSVAPDVILLSREKNRATRVGLLKLNLNASFGLSRQGGLYGGMLLDHFARQHFAHLGAPRPDQCLMLDVLGAAPKLYSAPQHTLRRLQRVASACREIGLLWPRIPSPEPSSAVA